MSSTLHQTLSARYPDAPRADQPEARALATMAARGSCRSFADRAVPDDLLHTLCAVALASPTKSDLQQRDIILLKSPEVRAEVSRLVSGQAWVAGAPTVAIFCGNNRRQRLLHDWHDVAFANDHLDALVNATADAAIALGAFVTAAEASGLGCCPISAVRNEARAIADLLHLPDHVFPFAGLAIGYPAETPPITPRLPLQATVHTDRYREDGLREAVETYDTRRSYGTQRFPEVFGTSDSYGWSEDKVRQYSQPERADFGDYIRAIGFKLD
ncbi:nitroreductase family protein [Gymnodinialimonas ceratoperidinii]|uniref:Nitroreductase family protein n=1 Tax=Gymnodinialimonas ceratoperidinii TaxID=2856823 RepID=A0A8F6YDC2_9RHOB|nr:nitroreductase family protein [Gymnodinialimonas ceratoperidinii]QXT40285.1 nitroreductase family protein [Gymnodinialimonas ceratoperidinii]